MSGLQFLLLEPNLSDLEAVQATLIEGGIDCKLLQVDSRTDFIRALEVNSFDLILSDYALLDFDGMAALEIARNLQSETPFIFVSASVGEELAIAALEAGAAGFVLKHRLERLVPCVQRVLRNAEENHDRVNPTLRESEERYRTLFESIDQGFCVIEVLFKDSQPFDYRFLEINPAFEKQTGLIDAQGKQVRELLPNHEEYWFEIYGNIALTGEPCRFENRAAALNRWYDVYAFRIGQPESRKVAVLFNDISDRKQAEASLRQSESRLRLMIESAKEYAIFTLDLNGMVTTWNAGAERLLGYLEAEIIGRNGRIVYTLEDRERGRAEREIQTALAEGRAENECWHVRRDSSRFWGSGLVMPLQDDVGNAQGLVKILQDKTTQRQTEAEREQLLQQEQAARAEAERANRTKDEFLAVLSHELRSPLNPILGWTQLLQNGKLDAARQREALATIERNARLQNQLIQDLLDISRIMQGKLSLTVAPVCLMLVIMAAVETVRLAAEAKQIQILPDLSTTVAPVSGDAARLQQVVWNLLTNAVKFTPNGGQVTVELRQLDQLAQIRVIDTGKGINPQFLPHVFEYFRQADSTTTRKFGGLGLGLAIVRQIVEMHGGTVKAESLGEDKGATFMVRLPILQQAVLDESKPSCTQAENTQNPLSNLEILVVEDDADTREFQVFLLKYNGARVTAVASGLEALQVLDQFIPDVLVSDIGMAEMDGYTLMQQIRSRPPNQGGTIPAIALTAYAMDFDQKRALQAGFQAHVVKPVEPEVLVKTIASLLD